MLIVVESFFYLSYPHHNHPMNEATQEVKSTWVELVITMSTKVQMPLVNNMISTHQQGY